jgi:hypothetical protein
VKAAALSDPERLARAGELRERAAKSYAARDYEALERLVLEHLLG